MTSQDFLVIAHRGASSYAPENTIAALSLALRMGVWHIELDVHLSRDGHLVVMHDDTVDRTTNGSGPVADQTLTERWQALDAGSWFGATFAGECIPTLRTRSYAIRDECTSIPRSKGVQSIWHSARRIWYGHMVW